MATVRERRTGKGGSELLCCGVCSYCAQGKIIDASAPQESPITANPQLGVSSLQKMAEDTFFSFRLVWGCGGFCGFFSSSRFLPGNKNNKLNAGDKRLSAGK